jgi:Flp pilus assembly pilin Flp
MTLSFVFTKFAKDESGAVTVDWVVLTAAIVGLGIYVTSIVGGGIVTLGNAIVNDLNNRNVGYVSP